MPGRPLLLASGSPRRHELLQRAGYTFSSASPDVEEVQQAGEDAEAMVVRLAVEKAGRMATTAEAGTCVLGCDTAVVLDEDVLGKPRDEDDAVETLLRLGGRTHLVVSGYALLVAGTSVARTGSERTHVHMRTISRAEATAYAESGEPLDRAGSYAIQGEGGRFVVGYEGSYSNVMGLPMEAIDLLLHELGVLPTVG